MENNYTGTTERDYADKQWLGRDDAFQLIPSEVAGALLVAGLCVCLLLDALQRRGLL